MPQRSQTIGFLITDVARLLRRRFEAALGEAGLGITPGEARTLFHASAAGPVRQSLLAERMAVEPMTLVGYLDRLEGRGLVERLADPRDRRAKVVATTTAAQPVLSRIAEVAAGVRAAALDGLSPAEAEALQQALVLMRANLGEAAAERVGA